MRASATALAISAARSGFDEVKLTSTTRLDGTAFTLSRFWKARSARCVNIAAASGGVEMPGDDSAPAGAAIIPAAADSARWTTLAPANSGSLVRFKVLITRLAISSDL